MQEQNIANTDIITLLDILASYQLAEKRQLRREVEQLHAESSPQALFATQGLVNIEIDLALTFAMRQHIAQSEIWRNNSTISIDLNAIPWRSPVFSAPGGNVEPDSNMPLF